MEDDETKYNISCWDKNDGGLGVIECKNRQSVKDKKIVNS